MAPGARRADCELRSCPIEAWGRTHLYPSLLTNFEAHFALINRAQRDALRDNARERTTKVLNRLRRGFLKDHPKTASHRDVEALLEDIEVQLVDASLEAETLRAGLRRIRHDFKINEHHWR